MLYEHKERINQPASLHAQINIAVDIDIDIDMDRYPINLDFGFTKKAF